MVSLHKAIIKYFVFWSFSKKDFEKSFMMFLETLLMIFISSTNADPGIISGGGITLMHYTVYYKQQCFPVKKNFMPIDRVQKIKTQTQNNLDRAQLGTAASEGLALMIKAMKDLDAPKNMPDGLDPVVWERFCLARQAKVESEHLVRMYRQDANEDRSHKTQLLKLWLHVLTPVGETESIDHGRDAGFSAEKNRWGWQSSWWN